MMLTWVRRIAETHNLPLATILAWDRGLLIEAIGQVLSATAEQEARQIVAGTRELPTDGSVFARAVRAYHAHFADLAREQKKRENDAAFAELIAAGAFGG